MKEIKPVDYWWNAQHGEDMEAEARKLAAEVMRLKARLFDLMEAQQGWTV